MRNMNFAGLRDAVKTTPKWMNNRNWERTYAIIRLDDGVGVFEARMYCTASGAQVGCRCRCHLSDAWGYGVGKAGGYGYDRESAALRAALNNMGLQFFDPVTIRGFNAGYLTDYIRADIEAQMQCRCKTLTFFGD